MSFSSSLSLSVVTVTVHWFGEKCEGMGEAAQVPCVCLSWSRGVLHVRYTLNP